MRIDRLKARAGFTFMTADDKLARILEPGAPLPDRRLAAPARVAAAWIETSVVMMPILPFIEDRPENFEGVVRSAAQNGAGYILPACAGNMSGLSAVALNTLSAIRAKWPGCFTICVLSLGSRPVLRLISLKRQVSRCRPSDPPEWTVTPIQ